MVAMGCLKNKILGPFFMNEVQGCGSTRVTNGQHSCMYDDVIRHCCGIESAMRSPSRSVKSLVVNEARLLTYHKNEH